MERNITRFLQVDGIIRKHTDILTRKSSIWNHILTLTVGGSHQVPLNSVKSSLTKKLLQNLYFDSVMLTANNEEELLSEFKISKQLSTEAKIDLRNFLSDGRLVTNQVVRLRASPLCFRLLQTSEVVPSVALDLAPDQSSVICTVILIILVPRSVAS